jgi:hypothetical protein
VVSVVSDCVAEGSTVVVPGSAESVLWSTGVAVVSGVTALSSAATVGVASAARLRVRAVQVS